MATDDKLSPEASRSLRRRRLGLSGSDGLVARSTLPLEGLLAADGIAEPGHRLAAWLADTFNHNFDNYDRAIDGIFNAGRGGSPAFHHLLDGQHSVWGAFNAVRDVAADDSWVAEMGQALEHLARDTASISGINPFFSLSADQFDRLGNLAADLGISKTFLADALTVNGPELLGGSVALVGALLMRGSAQPERLSRFGGGCLLSASLSANPLLMPIAAATMAYACVQAPDRKAVLIEGGKGALVSGTTVLVSSLVGGPAWLGCAAAFMAGVAVSKALDDPAAALGRARAVVSPAMKVFREVAPTLRTLQVAGAY